MLDLNRIYNIADAIGTAEALELARKARIAAHSFPRRNRALRNIFRKLRKMAKEAGVWRPGLGLEEAA